jgi:hypothetical protein
MKPFRQKRPVAAKLHDHLEEGGGASQPAAGRSPPPEDFDRSLLPLPRGRLHAPMMPFGSEKLQGFESLYRLRVGNYRILYEIDKAASLVTIARVAHRKRVPTLYCGAALGKIGFTFQRM